MASRSRPVVQVRPLADLTLGQLRGLLAGERRAWSEQLFWDLGDASELLEHAVRMGVVPGVAITVDGRAVASLTHHATGDVFRLCGLHVARGAPAAAAHLLVEAALAAPEAEDRRIEGQLFGFDHQAAVNAALSDAGLELVPREYLALDLPGAEPRALPPARGLRVRALLPADVPACAEVLVAAHAGGVEARINAAFRTHGPANAYLTEVSSGPGCGTVHPEASTVVIGITERIEGFCLITTIGDGAGHVVQVAVRPEAQGKGVGSLALARAETVLRRGGYSVLTLSVSIENGRALAWYRRWGFARRTAFAACHREIPGRSLGGS